MTDKEILLSVALGAVFVALLFCLLAIIGRRQGLNLIGTRRTDYAAV